jgi:D-alanyl-D-alanine carboxypeptidase
MRSITAGRAATMALSVALLAGLPGVANAADTDALTNIAPPSLESALAVLLPGSAWLAGEGADGSLELAKMKLPACGIKDQPTRYGAVRQWKRTLLDTHLKLRRSYKPRDLVSVSRANIKGSGKVRKMMIADLKAMAAASRKAGKPLAVRSTYRSYDYQKALFNSYVRSYGYAKAVSFSARPGHSEHQMGTTIDFTTAPSVPLSTRFGDSPPGKWIARNGWRYGFIMSYPKGKKSASCYSYEPWHWRYFGRDLAGKIHASGQVPRRYLYENFESAP